MNGIRAADKQWDQAICWNNRTLFVLCSQYVLARKRLILISRKYARRAVNQKTSGCPGLVQLPIDGGGKLI
jgi:hypothetical protein